MPPDHAPLHLGHCDSELERLEVDYRAATEAIDLHLESLRNGCEHEDVLRAYIGGANGYLWRCSRCFVEEHSWGPYVFKPKATREVSRKDFLNGRPKGAGLVMVDAR